MTARPPVAHSHPARKRHRHAPLHLPALEPEQALLVVEVLERVIRSIWHTHGDAMADYLGCVDPDSERMQRPRDAQWECSDSPSDNDDYDF